MRCKAWDCYKDRYPKSSLYLSAQTNHGMPECCLHTTCMLQPSKDHLKCTLHLLNRLETAHLVDNTIICMSVIACCCELRAFQTVVISFSLHRAWDHHLPLWHCPLLPPFFGHHLAIPHAQLGVSALPYVCWGHRSADPASLQPTCMRTSSCGCIPRNCKPFCWQVWQVRTFVCFPNSIGAKASSAQVLQLRQSLLWGGCRHRRPVQQEARSTGAQGDKVAFSSDTSLTAADASLVHSAWAPYTAVRTYSAVATSQDRETTKTWSWETGSREL
jgi:hypothetical protein